MDFLAPISLFVENVDPNFISVAVFVFLGLFVPIAAIVMHSTLGGVAREK